MAQGGGRGWFHRKRQQPDPEPDNGTTHASTLRPPAPDSRSAAGPQSSETPTPGTSWNAGTPLTQSSVVVSDDNEQWSPEARDPEAASPSIPDQVAPVTVPAWHATATPPPPVSNPTTESWTASPEWAPPSSPPASFGAPTASVTSEPTAGPRGESPTGPANSGTAGDAGSAAPSTSLPGPASNPTSPAGEAAPAASPPPVTTSIDWDVATAAALTDETGADDTALPHSLPKTSPDRLLEDLIREIVGDAAADTVSSLQTPRTDVSESTVRSAEEGQPHEAQEVTRSADEHVDEVQQDGLELAPTWETSPPSVADVHEHPVAAEPWTEPTPAASTIADEATSATVGGASQWDARIDQRLATDTPPPSAPASTSVDEAQAENPVIEADPDPQPASSATVVPGTLDPRESPNEPVLDRIQTDPPSLPTIDIPASVSRETTAQEPATTVSRETSTQYGGTPLADQLADETRRRQALEGEVLPLPARTRIMTISNQKGGVGKTTTAVNLAAALARTGAHVLVIDLDPQGNASTALGVDHRSEQQSVYEVLVADLPLSEVVQPSTEHERLDCVPATIHLAGAEIELVSLVAREQRLRRALDAHLAAMDRPYDYVFIDCPPSLGLLTINAFVAAREVLIPIQCEYYALEGLSQLLSNIELIEKHLNPDLRLSTILLTMYDSRTNLAQQVAQEVRDHFPTQTLGTIIPRSVRVSEAPSYGQSVISYDFASTGSLSYREAAAEIARRGLANQNTQKDMH
ncbi:AAA family ATPase [Agromyces mariniharenae]|uniref:AAA family ATPase n=1 Tax=Agromyces mariniharenae TaxID=2604423 RepID=A0A5S4VHJ6_9MICO|nr:AAA family ATPase [Agromyces mariniharenae]